MYFYLLLFIVLWVLTMTDNDTIELQDDNNDVTQRDSTEKNPQSVLQSLLQHRFANPLLRVARVLLYSFGIWTILLYYWSIIGIAIGMGVTIISNERIWRIHGIVLAYGTGIMAPLLSGYSFLLTLFVLLFLIVYYIGALLLFGITSVLGLIRRIRNQPKKQPKIPSFSFGALSRIKFLLVLGILLAPMFLWASVDVDLGVMFDTTTASLWINTPSNADVDEEFDIYVEAWDSFERLSPTFRGTVSFSIQSYDLTTGATLASVDAMLPEDYTFTGYLYTSGIVPAYKLAGTEDYGVHAFSMQISTPGIHYILIEDTQTQNTYWSNPVVVDNYAENTPRIYWGDLHGHSAVSDGSGTAEESYYYGRYVSRLDYMALTDHGEHFTIFDRTKADSPEWENYKLATTNAYDPGNFVAFYGAEWTTNYALQPFLFVPVPIITGGHYTCVFSGDDIPLFSTYTENTTDQLWSLLDDFTSSTGAGALAIPHHTIRSMFIQDWTMMNPNYVRLAEVTSVHGESLFDNELNYRGSVDLPAEPISGSSIIDALNMGYRMTFMANGDNHDGHPGHSISHTRASVGHQYPYTLYNARNGHPYPGGITAVYATGLTRADVFSGLQNGQVYATSDHGRPVLDFSINGIPVGYNSTVMVPTTTSSRNLSIFVAQDGAPAAGLNQAATAGAGWIPDWAATVEIIKNGEIWQTVQISTPTARILISDSTEINGASYEGYIQGEDGNYYINDQSINPVDPDTLNTGGMDYYAIRIVGSNGRTSYIGPIWVSSP